MLNTERQLKDKEEESLLGKESHLLLNCQHQLDH